VVFATRAWRKKGDDSLGAVISQRTDTALLSTRAYRQKGVDSLVTLISTLGGGTVLSVSAGTGMNFTTITTSGSVNADTNVLATRANRDKLKDSLQANIAAKVNISDTSTMLSPYVRAAGFGLTKSGQSLLVDSALIATRARVQKGIDSVAGLSRVTGSGTTNYLPKWTGSTALGNSLVFDNGTNVLVNTTTAVSGYTFQVAGNMYNTTGAVLAASSGNVGIGTTPSNWNLSGLQALQIKSNAIYGIGTEVGLVNNTYYDATAWKYISSAAAAQYIQTNGSHFWFTAPSGTADNNVSLSERMRLTAAGRLLVGTSTEGTNTVDIAGTLRVATQGYGLIRLERTTTDAGIGYLGASAGSSLLISNGALTQIGQVQINQATVAGTIATDASSNVGIGTTSPSYKLDVQGTLRSTQGANFATSSGAVGIGTITPTTGQILDVTGDAYYRSKLNVGNTTYTATGGAGRVNISSTLAFVPDNTGNSNNRNWGMEANGFENGSLDFLISSVNNAYPNAAYAVNFTRSGGILARGNVGIGTASPDENLTVVGDGDGLIRIGSGVGGNTANIGLTGAISSTNYSLSGDAGNNNLAINRPTGGAMSFRSNNTAQMTLTNSGRLLIGTETEATQELHVVGDARITVIDSSASPINMLWADNNGVIRKAAVPAGGGGSVDTATIATRARVQKAVDSINVNNASGTGLSGYMTRWTGAKTLDTSQIQQINGNIEIGSAVGYQKKFTVTGETYLNGNVLFNITNAFGMYVMQPKNTLGMILASTSDPLGADTIVAGIGFGTNTHQAPARIQAISAQAWNSTDRGVYLSFRVTPTTTTQNYEMMRIQDNGEVIIGQDWADQGAYRLQVNGVAYAADGLRTGTPSGGTAATWKLGTVATVSPTSPNRTIEVDIGGTIYYIHAKTTNN